MGCLWEHLADDPILECPYHANGNAVPRAPATAIVADVTVDLQEFDSVGQRGDIAMFKRVKTRRYFDVRAIRPTAVTVEHRDPAGVVHRSVSEALQWARGLE